MNIRFLKSKFDGGFRLEWSIRVDNFGVKSLLLYLRGGWLFFGVVGVEN